MRCAFLFGVIGVASGAGVTAGSGSDWTRIGPWNIFDGTDPTKSPSMGEAGTLASAASPKANPARPPRPLSRPALCHARS